MQHFYGQVHMQEAGVREKEIEKPNNYASPFTSEMTKRGSSNIRKECSLLCRSLSLPLVQYNHTERRYPMKKEFL